MPDTLSDTQRDVLELANCVAFDVLATRTGADALRGLVNAALVLTSARYAALGVARKAGTGWSEFIAAGITPEEEALMAPLSKEFGMFRERNESLQSNKKSEVPESGGILFKHPSLTSFLGISIQRGDVVLGSLYLCNKQEGEDFSHADEITMHALCAHAAVAIHHLEMLSQQRSLVRGLMMAQEEERRAVAYDLHDGLTQYVMASQAHLEAFQIAQQSGQAEKAARDLEQGLKLLNEAVVESRRLVNGLRLLALDDLGLAGALEHLIQEEKVRARWESADFIHNITARRFEETLETAIYRVAQEALTNARRHAAASQVRVLLLEETPVNATNTASITVLRLEVTDWGCGFDSEQSIDSKHIGLHGIVERIQLLGGTYNLRSKPGERTTLCATFPALPPTNES